MTRILVIDDEAAVRDEEREFDSAVRMVTSGAELWSAIQLAVSQGGNIATAEVDGVRSFTLTLRSA